MPGSMFDMSSSSIRTGPSWQVGRAAPPHPFLNVLIPDGSHVEVGDCFDVEPVTAIYFFLFLFFISLGI